MSRKIDRKVALEIMGWECVNELIVPPIGDERRVWAAHWDELGCPHWMPLWSSNTEDTKELLAYIRKKFGDVEYGGFLHGIFVDCLGEGISEENICKYAIGFIPYLNA